MCPTYDSRSLSTPRRVHYGSVGPGGAIDTTRPNAVDIMARLAWQKAWSKIAEFLYNSASVYLRPLSDWVGRNFGFVVQAVIHNRLHLKDVRIPGIFLHSVKPLFHCAVPRDWWNWNYRDGRASYRLSWLYIFFGYSFNVANGNAHGTGSLHSYPWRPRSDVYTLFSVAL